MNTNPSHEKRSRFRSPWILLVVVGCIAACTFPFLNGGPDLLAIVFYSAALSLASLVAAFLGIANGNWRFAAAPFAITGNGLLHGFSTETSFNWPAALIAVAPSVVVFTTLETIKFFFGSFRSVDDDEAVGDGLQFGIAQLMIFTGSIAVFISFVKFLSNFDIIFIVAVFVMAFTVFTLANVWALMGRAVKYRLLISLAAALLSVSPIFFLGPNDNVLTMRMLICAISWSVIALQFWLLRRSGLRFVRKSKASPT